MEIVKGKQYSIFGRNGMMEELTPKKDLPLHSRVYNHDGRQYAIISTSNAHRSQQMVSISEYEHVFSAIDEYARPISKRFGIGHYFDDIEPEFRFTEEEVTNAINQAKEADTQRANKAQEEATASNLLTEKLKEEFSFLIINPGSYVDIKGNIIAYLKFKFPGTRFSILKKHYNSIIIKWTNGPTENEVESEADVFSPYAFDESGDYLDYHGTEFSSLFGNIKFMDYERTETETPQEPLNNPTETPNKKLEDIEIVDYSAKSFAIIGNTKPIKEQLKELGGSFNPRLTCGAGWIFQMSKKQAVISAISKQL